MNARYDFSMSKFLFAYFFLCFFSFVAAGELCAHVAAPTGTKESQVGEMFILKVWEAEKNQDGSRCKAWIQVKSDDSKVALVVAPDNPSSEPAELPPTTDGFFEVYTGTDAAAGASTNITIHYRGEDTVNGTSGPCQGDGYYYLTVKLTPAPVKETTANTPSAGNEKDPVNTSNGELFFHEPFDLSLGGPMPLYFQRYYASHLKADGITSDLGNNWRHNFDWSLRRVNSGITITDDMGRIVRFLKQGGIWQQQDSLDIPYQIVEGTDSVILYNPKAGRFYTFNDLGRLVTVGDGKGNTHYLFYNDFYEWPYTGRLFAVTDTSDMGGRGLYFAYNYCGPTCVGKLHAVTEIQNNVQKRYVMFGYTGENLTGFTDVMGRATTYSYATAGDMVGLMTFKTMPAGNKPYTQTYDGQGRVITQADSRGNATTFAYDSPTLGVTTVTAPLGPSIKHTHNDQKALTQWMDPAGQIISMTYDGSNRRKSVTDRLGDTTTLAYHAPSGKVSSITDAAGQTTTFTYSSRTQGGFSLYDLTRINYPDGTTATMTYDSSGNMLTQTDRVGKLRSFTYNANGQPLTETNPAGGVTTATYNPDGTISGMKDHFNNLTAFDYDANRRLIKTTHPDSTLVQYTYNNNDNVLTVTNEREKVTTFTYDANNRLKTIKDPLNNVVTINYDGNDRMISFVDKLNKTTAFDYDELGRLKKKTNAAGEATDFGYDAEDRLTSVTDPAGKQVMIGYDKEGVVASITDPLGNIWSVTTDKLGRMTRTTSPLAGNRLYSYNAGGWLASYANQVSKETTYSYDNRGLLTSVHLPEGISASYTRNDTGQVLHVIDALGNAWDRTYDQTGRLLSRTDPLNKVVTYSYDSRDRLTGMTFPEGSLQITYDGVGNITGRRYSDGIDLSYVFDDNDLLVSANGFSLSYDAMGRITGSNGLAIARDNVGRISSITPASGKVLTYVYNNRGFVSRVSDWIGGNTDLTYDDNGRLLTLSRPNGVTTTYSYDNDGRLASVTESKSGPLSSIVLTRNAAGEVISANRTVPLLPDMTNANRISTYNKAGQVTGYTYDNMGRLTSDGVRTFTWDLASRLTALSQGGNSVTCTYDALGMRVSRTSGGIATEYVWNYALGIPSVSVVKQGGNDRYYYVHLPDGQLLYRIAAADNSRHFYHFDEAGSTLYLTVDGGAIAESYGITPFGRLTSSGGPADNPFTFIGAYGVMQEGDSGLYYMRARYYDSITGRFISPDPVKSMHPSEINPYQYVRGNPLKNKDPLGLEDGWTTVTRYKAGNIPDRPEIEQGIRGAWDAGLGDIRDKIQEVVVTQQEGLPPRVELVLRIDKHGKPMDTRETEKKKGRCARAKFLLIIEVSRDKTGFSEGYVPYAFVQLINVRTGEKPFLAEGDLSLEEWFDILGGHGRSAYNASPEVQKKLLDRMPGTQSEAVRRAFNRIGVSEEGAINIKESKPVSPGAH